MDKIKVQFLKPATLLLVLLLSGLCIADYTVRGGDSLSEIADSQLGDGSRWSEIAELNGIEDPYNVAVGQVLKMPGEVEVNVTKPQVTYNAPVTIVTSEEGSPTESRRKFDPIKILFSVLPTWGGLFGVGVVFYIIYVIVLTFMWAVSMRLNCHIMILPEIVPFSRCLKLAVAHILLAVLYAVVINLLFMQAWANYTVAVTSIGVFVILFIIWLALYATKRTIGTGWFWAFLFLVFSATVNQLLAFAVILSIVSAGLCVFGVSSLF